jgi:hypothetical protein
MTVGWDQDLLGAATSSSIATLSLDENDGLVKR